MQDCQIQLDDNSLSRCHCTIYYDGCWVLADGDGEKSSTNGTWYFAEQFFEIYNGMVFKAAQTLFQASIDMDVGDF